MSLQTLRLQSELPTSKGKSHCMWQRLDTVGPNISPTRTDSIASYCIWLLQKVLSFQETFTWASKLRVPPKRLSIVRRRSCRILDSTSLSWGSGTIRNATRVNYCEEDVKFYGTFCTVYGLQQCVYVHIYCRLH
jgi:hypothetical protein